MDCRQTRLHLKGWHERLTLKGWHERLTLRLNDPDYPTQGNDNPTNPSILGLPFSWLQKKNSFNFRFCIISDWKKKILVRLCVCLYACTKEMKMYPDSIRFDSKRMCHFVKDKIKLFFTKLSRLRGSWGACAEALRKGSGCLEHWSHLIHSVVRLSPVLWRKRR